MDTLAAALAGARFAGLLLLAGGLALVLLAAASAAVPAAIWTGVPAVSLPLIARHRAIWRSANVGFALATILTVAGLFLLPASLGAGGAALATAAAVGYAIAGSAWLVTLGIRLGITPRVAAAYASSGVVDPRFAPLAGLGGVLFTAFILVGCASLALLGAAVVLGGVVPAWAGWATLGASLAILADLALTGDTLPAFVYLPSMLLGVVLLSAA